MTLKRVLAAAVVAVGVGAVNVDEKGASFTPDANAQGCTGQTSCTVNQTHQRPETQPGQTTIINQNTNEQRTRFIPVPSIGVGSPPSGGFCTSGWTFSVVGPFAGIGAGRSHPDPQCINNISYLEMMRSNDAGTRLLGTIFFLNNNPELRPHADQLIENFRTACAPQIVQKGVSIALLPTSQELMERSTFNCAQVGWLNTQQVQQQPAQRQVQRQPAQRQAQRQGQPPQSCGIITFNAETQTVTVNQHNSCTGNLGSGAQGPQQSLVPRAN